MVSLREAGIDPNCWYGVARSTELGDRPLAVELWGRSVVIYRQNDGAIAAMDDCCPHRFVKLSDGVVVDGAIECPYHGWQFNGDGGYKTIPYLAPNQRLPSCRIPTYPVREQDGFIWLYPVANVDPDTLPPPMPIPEWDHLNYIASVATVDCPGHFSFLIENLMDMYHGHLHDDYQAWANPRLENLVTEGGNVTAEYAAESYYRIDKIWSVIQLFMPSTRKLHPEPLHVSYRYPHWHSTLGDDFVIYCLFCPVGPQRTKAYLIHFTSLNAFWRLHKLPVPFRRWVKNRLFNAAKGMLEGLVRQDVRAIAQEQQAYLANPNRRGPEYNPALSAVQRLIRERAASASMATESIGTDAVADKVVAEKAAAQKIVMEKQIDMT